MKLADLSASKAGDPTTLLNHVALLGPGLYFARH
jgi:hypothetical protein